VDYLRCGPTISISSSTTSLSFGALNITGHPELNHLPQHLSHKTRLINGNGSSDENSFLLRPDLSLDLAVVGTNSGHWRRCRRDQCQQWAAIIDDIQDGHFIYFLLLHTHLYLDHNRPLDDYLGLPDRFRLPCSSSDHDQRCSTSAHTDDRISFNCFHNCSYINLDNIVHPDFSGW
jgi:hypothetical protein